MLNHATLNNRIVFTGLEYKNRFSLRKRFKKLTGDSKEYYSTLGPLHRTCYCFIPLKNPLGSPRIGMKRCTLKLESNR